MKYQIKLLAVIFSVLVVFSCKEKEGYSKIEKKKTQSTSSVHKIIVNEFLDGGSYAYIHVNESGNKYWMAIPSMNVKVGETYYYNGGMLMKDFESKQLKRTFDFITFVEGIRITKQPNVIKEGNPHVKADKVVEEMIKIETPKNGISFETLFKNKESYVNTSIIVKGKVVKVNNGIMEKNWVHINDGTQFEGKKSLTITTLEIVKVGDIVTFKGLLILDKDFGQGYVYDILVEDGELIK